MTTRFVGISSVDDPQARRRDTLTFIDHDAPAPLSNIEKIEFRDDGSILVAPKGSGAFSARVRNESRESLELVPAVSGFTYEPNGALINKPEEPDKPYFKEHEIRFAEIRKMTVTNDVPRDNRGH